MASLTCRRQPCSVATRLWTSGGCTTPPTGIVGIADAPAYVPRTTCQCDGRLSLLEFMHNPAYALGER